MISTARQYAVPCAIPGCQQWTADQAPARHWVTAAAAVHAARVLGWLTIRAADGRHVWACTRHQVWDPRRGRWIIDNGARA